MSDKAREAFEATCDDPRSIERNADGEYKLMQTYRGWIDFKLGYQAATEAARAEYLPVVGALVECIEMWGSLSDNQVDEALAAADKIEKE